MNIFFLILIVSCCYRSYEGRKDLFEQRQQVEYIQTRKIWEEKLRNELKMILKSVGYRSDDESDDESDEDVK